MRQQTKKYQKSQKEIHRELDATDRGRSRKKQGQDTLRAAPQTASSTDSRDPSSCKHAGDKLQPPTKMESDRGARQDTIWRLSGSHQILHQHASPSHANHWGGRKCPFWLEEWQQIPKNGDLKKCKDCRGITLLSTPGKVLYHILLERLKKAFNILNNIWKTKNN